MAESNKIIFENASFGRVSIDRSAVVTFPHGLPGFERFRVYGIVEAEEEHPFMRLLSLEEPRLGFVLVDPTLVWPDYDPAINPEDMAGLDVSRAEQLSLYALVTLSERTEDVTVNLKGPVCINTDSMLAKQMILVDDRYHTRHRLVAAGRDR